MNIYKRISVFTLVLLTLSGCHWFETEPDPDAPNSAEIEEEEGDPYELIFASSLDKKIEENLKAVSLLVKLEKRPPLSRTGLVKRAEKDKEQFKKVIASFGYFSGSIDFIIHEDKKPLQVEFKIDLGTCYKIGDITLLCMDQEANLPPLSSKLTHDIIGIQTGDFVKLEKVQAGKEKVKKYFQHHGYAFVQVQEPEAILDNKNHTLQVIYRVHTGHLSRIQQTNITGLKNLSTPYVRNRILWKDGEIYDQEVVDQTRRKLIETGLLANVNIDPTELAKTSASNSSEGQPIRMDIKTTESAPRAIGAGARFATSEGIGGHLFWHHNNLRGNGEHLGVSIRQSKRERMAKLVYEIPDLLAPQQKLINEIASIRERTRAYVGRTYTIGTQIEQPLNDKLSVSAGVIGENSKIRREDRTYNMHLVGVPGEVKVNASNSLLDPTQGFKTNVRCTPYFGKLDSTHRNLTIAQGGLSAYLPFMTNEVGESKGVLAAFVKGGTLFTHDLDIVPPNKRFYGGGGGSVRGYGYQLIGPIDSERVPLGGRSLAEFGTELRIKTTETIGVVAFLEAGSVTNSKSPDFKGKDLLWGAGFGGRYYSGVGPIRVDLAFPLKRRRSPDGGKSIDAPFQFYISIGQAF